MSLLSKILDGILNTSHKMLIKFDGPFFLFVANMLGFYLIVFYLQYHQLLFEVSVFED